MKGDEGQIAGMLHRVLEDFPDLLLGSYPYFDNPVYSIKLTLDSKDPTYVDRVRAALVTQPAKLDLHPLNVRL